MYTWHSRTNQTYHIRGIQNLLDCSCKINFLTWDIIFLHHLPHIPLCSNKVLTLFLACLYYHLKCPFGIESVSCCNSLQILPMVLNFTFLLNGLVGDNSIDFAYNTQHRTKQLPLQWESVVTKTQKAWVQKKFEAMFIFILDQGNHILVICPTWYKSQCTLLLQCSRVVKV